MEKLTVDAEGRIVIPPKVAHKYGLRPGEEVLLVETVGGLLIRPNDAEAWAWARGWWESLTEKEKRAARDEADRYESLTEDERDAIWNQFPVSIEEETEGDEIELATSFSSRAIWIPSTQCCWVRLNKC